MPRLPLETGHLRATVDLLEGFYEDVWTLLTAQRIKLLVVGR